MIQNVFDKEIEQMRAIANARTIIGNFKYRLVNDKNVQLFLESLVSNITNYDSLERMEKYYFINDFDELLKVLEYLYSGSRAHEYFNKMDSAEFAKPCHALPDYGGQSILKLIAYLPIMKLFQEKRHFLDMQKKDFESDVHENIPMHQSLENMQEDKLFKKESMFYRKYPDDDSFVNHPLKKRYAKSIAADYEECKEELDASILSLANLYSKDSLLMIGSTYWDNSNKARAKSAKAFEGMLEAFSSSFKKIDELF